MKKLLSDNDRTDSDSGGKLPANGLFLLAEAAIDEEPPLTENEAFLSSIGSVMIGYCDGFFSFPEMSSIERF